MTVRSDPQVPLQMTKWVDDMRHAQVPKVLIVLLALLAHTDNVHQGQADLDGVEFFAGDRSITMGARRRQR